MFGQQSTRTLLKPADPALNATVPAPRISAADLIVLAEASTGTADTQRSFPPPQAGRPSRRFVLTAAALTVAAATVASVTVANKPGGTQNQQARDDLGVVLVPIAYQVTTDPPAAGENLRRLAGRITDAPSDRTFGQYTHCHVKSWGGMQMSSPDGHVLNYVEEQQTWTAQDGSGRVRTTMLAPEFPDEESRQYWTRRLPLEARGSEQHEDSLPPGLAGPTRPLPSDRAGLAALLHAGNGSSPGDVAKAVGTVYSQYVVPRQARETMLDILAGVPGFVWRGDVTDRAGRAGLAITADDNGRQTLLIFDRATGALLAHESVGLQSERVQAYLLILESDRTDSLG